MPIRLTSLRRCAQRLLRHVWRMDQDRRRRQHVRVELSSLTERELADIGMTPGEIECIAARRNIDRYRDELRCLMTLSRM
jgi:uncharacterized protein YjiS (DUF1127 family)